MTARAMQTCVVLAGGLGTRLRSAVPDRPKCLAPVGRRAFLDIQLEALQRAGIDDVVFSLGHMADAVIKHLSQCASSIRLRFVVEKEALGTGGAIAHVIDQLGLNEVIVANGDTYLSGDISPMLPPLRRSEGELLRLGVVEVPDRRRFGGVLLAHGGAVTGFLEKGESGPGNINAGLYRLCRQALPAFRIGPYSLEAEVLPALVAQGVVRATRLDGDFTDIGVPEDYHRFCEQHGQ